MIERSHKNNKKILILGGSSFIGRYLFSRIGPDQAIATYYRHPFAQGVYFDALKMQILDIVEKPEVFSHAIILLANTNPDSCVRNVEQSTYLNVTRIHNIIDQLKIFRIIPVFMSSEAVFDGEKGDYIESDPISPILTYGSQKAQIEQYLQQTCQKFLVARLARVFGSRRSDGTLFTAWLEQIENNLTISCASNQFLSPIHVDEVVKGLIRLIQNDCTGIFHFSSKDAYSRLSLLKCLIGYYKKYKPKEIKIIERKLGEFPTIEKRPLNLSMSPDKMVQATGLQIKGIDFWCREITDNWFRR